MYVSIKKDAQEAYVNIFPKSYNFYIHCLTSIIYFTELSPKKWVARQILYKKKKHISLTSRTTEVILTPSPSPPLQKALYRAIYTGCMDSTYPFIASGIITKQSSQLWHNDPASKRCVTIPWNHVESSSSMYGFNYVEDVLLLWVYSVIKRSI